MIAREVLKDIIIDNERFILEKAGKIVGREGVRLPEGLRKIVVLYGARRSGKTYILFDLFRKAPESSLYVDFEDERLAGFGAADFERLRDAFLELKPHLAGRRVSLLLDEVQNVEGWEKFCRRVAERGDARVLVSGSSSKIMPSELHTELRGRSWGIEVLPFSFFEYLRASGLDPADAASLHGEGKAAVKRHFLRYLRWGGFPEVAALALEADRTKLLREYMGAMFFKDLVERYGIRNIPLFDILSDKLFSSFSLKVSLSAFYKQHKDTLPLSKDLVFRYYKHFLDSLLVFEARKLAESHYARMRSPAKIYLVDAGLAKRIASEDAGRLLENAVYLESRRRGYEVFFHEGDRECDFVATSGGEAPRPLQVTYELTDANREREVGGLLEACRRLRRREGTILTYDDEGRLEQDSVKVTIQPVWRWLLSRGP